MKHLWHVVSVLATAAALAAGGPGCGKSSGQPTTEAVSAESAVTEKNGDLEITWDITPEGQVTARVKNKDDMPVTADVAATVTVTPPGGGAGTPVPLALQPGGVLTGQIPKLEGDLTEVSYDVKAGGATATGTMHLPRGGTRELVTSANEAAAAKAVTAGKKGPNGGVVQVVGDDVVEVVADKSGAARMYFLDDDLKVVPAGKKKGKLAFVGASPVVVELDPDPSGVFLVAKAPVKVEPVKITVVVTDGDEVDVALCGYAPGGVIVVGPAAPVIAVFVVTAWPVVVVQPGVVVIRKGKGKGKGKWKWW